MGEKGDTSKKQTQLQQQQHQQDYDSSSPKDPLDESIETRPHGTGHHPHPHHHHHHHHHQDSSSIVAAPFISAPLYIPSGVTAATPFEAVNPKRTRYTAGQWKLLPSPSSQPQIAALASDSSPSPSKRPTTAAAASSSDTASSPSHSPMPSISTASGQQETGNKAEGESQIHQQYRKGKYVSPVWKPNEMLWLARAWRVQYQGGGSDLVQHEAAVVGGQPARGGGKTRADKDREVAEFLQKHGVNRDAKTAGTKWDNMLGEFRKVYEWERGGEREQLVGKSYFRLSPYERKLHRLPASFDEQVFEELSQFMGSKMRTSKPTTILPVTRALPPPPPFREDDLHLSARTKQVLGLDYSSVGANSNPSHSYSSKEVRRIGRVRMVWEESVSLWAEEGEQQRGRIRVQGSSFLNADELTFFDEAMVACTMESYDDGPLKGFSVDRFVSGQQIKVFGRRKSPSAASPYTSTGPTERLPLHSAELSIRSNPTWDYQDPTEYYVGCLRIPPPSLPSLLELSWHLQDPPSEELRFPIRKDVYGYLPQGKELFFTTSSDMLDCRSFVYEILCPIIRTNPSISSATASSRDSFIALWDDCINRLVSEFCCMEMVIIRKPSSPAIKESLLQDQWPNVTGFIRNFCLWRGEETDQVRDGHLDPSNSIVEKLLWTYIDIPYLLGYYAVGYLVTFCALSRAQDRVIRTDLYSLDLSTPGERLKALVPCYRIAGVLSLLADRCYKLPIQSDFERIDLGNGTVAEMTPNTVTKFFSCRRRWAAVKEIYDFLDHRIPHSEFIFGSSDKDLALVFKPRLCRFKPSSYEQLVEALKNVTKALVALHDLSFMHRDISWEKVMKKKNDKETAAAEWVLCGFEEAVGAPQIYPHGESSSSAATASGRHAPEMERGLHGVKVDMWGVGYLIKTCGLTGLPKMLRELQNRCMDQNPEHRPTAADCYHHLLQLQSSLSTTAGGALM